MRDVRQFEGKVALVTGGTSGIGRAAALAFAREGARVVVAGRRSEAGEQTVQLIREAGGDALFVRTDVTQAAEVEALVNKTLAAYGRLDYAFNNAGTEGGLGPISELSEEQWDQTLAVNLKGTWLCLKYEIPAILKQGGAIINNASILGTIGMPGMTIYAAAKSGIIGMTRAAAIEYAQAGVRINVISPGAIETDMLDRFAGGDAAVKAQLGASHPIGRAGRPEEIAAAVIWLASEAASFVTGHNLVVDGGYTAQ
jgi:NAD(P)-dependent dehydrogenase (short-subunit alcohol dehydrogenase family)